MQPPPPEVPATPAVAPPGAPAPAPAPSATALLPEGPVPLSGIPRSAQEVQGLRARRDMLRDQLVRAQNRREELVQQLNRPNPDAVKVGIQQRLTLIDERIMQLERDQALTERQLTSTPAEVLASTTEQRDQRGMMDEDDAAGMAFGTFGLGILLTLILGRIRRRFARRRAGKLGQVAVQGAAASDDPRIERLTQAVDAIALEVERIGEGQRFVTQLLANQRPGATLAVEAERR